MSFFGGGGRSAPPSQPASTTQIVREAPGIEERKIELMDLARQVAQDPVTIPAEQVAGLAALEQAGLTQAGQTGVGSGTVGSAVTGVQSAMAPVGAQQISQYFNPFQQFVTSEIARQGQIMQNRLGANAIRAGAFGGGREGVQQAELQGRTLSEIGRAQAQGFNTALQAAQNQQRIGLSGGQLLGALGAQQQRMAQQDINQLMAAGGVQRQLAQATLDAQRRTQLQQAYEPYQRLGFLSNIYAAGPKTQSQIEMATAPQTNPLAQSIGTGLGAFQAFTGVQGA
jgi:hypothetical protein|tara:strand:- start:1304 stop:2152 length:849 start_codon:yes stop_codon:yes gene_type:complete